MRKDVFNLGFLFNPWLSVYADWLDLVSNTESIMRRFIRHPSDIPIAYSMGRSVSFSDRLRDIGHGGLCFSSKTPVQAGSSIHIEINLNQSPFEADGTVAWCKREDDSYAVGVAFNDNSTHYGVRMVEQVCHIEHYRSEVLATEGRELSSEEAAKEWVEKYAADFPNTN